MSWDILPGHTGVKEMARGEFFTVGASRGWNLTVMERYSTSILQVCSPSSDCTVHPNWYWHMFKLALEPVETWPKFWQRNALEFKPHWCVNTKLEISWRMTDAVWPFIWAFAHTSTSICRRLAWWSHERRGYNLQHKWSESVGRTIFEGVASRQSFQHFAQCA